MQALSIWSIIFAVGAGQGILLGSALLTMRVGNKAAGRIVGVMTLFLAAIVAEESIDASNLYAIFPWAVGATINFEFLVGPFLYLYVRAILDNTGVRSRDLLHFTPFILSGIVLIPFFQLSGAERLSVLNNELPAYLQVIFVAKPVHFFVYLIKTLGQLRRVKDAEQHDALGVKWLRRGIYMITAIVAISVLLFWLTSLGLGLPVDSDHFSSLALTVATYTMAFLMIQQPGLFARVVGSRRGSKYDTSPLGDEEKQIWAGQLIEYMQKDAPYLNADFRLATMARALGLPSHHLSQVLNEAIGLNFHEFVNRYRVRYVESLIQDEQNRAKTLLTLAMASGFNSKASFNRAFKRHTGLAPSAYRREYESQSPQQSASHFIE